jgi:hypothetical protein
MRKDLPLICPSCSGELGVRNLICAACGTTVEGLYTLPILARLNREEQEFILQFIKFSGSLKEMAAFMKLSYPTVRNQLDDLIQKIASIERKGKSHEKNS